MEDKRLEDIEFRQDFIEKDSGSPLHMIREKEMEISGRVLKAKREAEDLVSDARRKAAEHSSKIEAKAVEAVASQEAEIRTKFEKEAVTVREEASKELSTMEDRIAGAKAKAAEAVVDMVTDL
jgi:vacuolar-type H+-ATPase subunit H